MTRSRPNWFCAPDPVLIRSQNIEHQLNLFGSSSRFPEELLNINMFFRTSRFWFSGPEPVSLVKNLLVMRRCRTFWFWWKETQTSNLQVADPEPCCAT